MKKLGLGLIAAGVLVLGCLANSHADPGAGDLGLGVFAGSPNVGATGKYWFGHHQSMDFGLGSDDGDMTLMSDFIWSGWTAPLKPSQGSLSAYLAGGGRFKFQGSDTRLGFRGLVGLSYWPTEKYPVELYVEVGPLFWLTQNNGVIADGDVGVRYYFSMAHGSSDSNSK